MSSPEEEAAFWKEEAEAARRELADFVYKVSHDFSAQLRSIEVFSRHLEAEFGESFTGRSAEYLRFVTGASARLNEMVAALLELSRVDRAPGEARPVPLGQVVEGAIAALKGRLKERPLTVRVENPEFLVVTYPRVLQRILTKLLDNACKFAAEGDGEVIVAACQNPDGVDIRVSDHGIGIPERYREAVFQIFRSLHPEGRYPGVGAGLTIARQSARFLGGDLCLEETPGGGVTAVLRLRT